MPDPASDVESFDSAMQTMRAWCKAASQRVAQGIGSRYSAEDMVSLGNAIAQFEKGAEILRKAIGEKPISLRPERRTP